MEETLMYNSYSKIHMNFLFLSLFKDCPSQFLSHWESAEPVFCGEELSFLLYINHLKPKENPVLGGKIQNVKNFTEMFLPPDHL